MPSIPSPFILIARIVLAIFAVELIIDLPIHFLIPDSFELFRGLADSILLVLGISPLLWLIAIKSLGSRGGEGTGEYGHLGLFFQVLAIAFFTEFAIMLLLPRLFPTASPLVQNILDALLLSALCAPLIWLAIRRRRISIGGGGELQTGQLPPPFSLFYRLIAAIFLVELAVMLFLQYFHPHATRTVNTLLDTTLLGIFSVPVLWWLVVQPLRQSAKAEKARFESVSSQVVDAVVTFNPQGTIESFNHGAERIFGYLAAEVVGKSVQSLFPVAEQELGSLIDATAALAGEQVAVQREASGVRKGGASFPVSMTVSKADLGERPIYVLILRDITSLKQAEQEQKRMLSLFEAILESTADGIEAVNWNRNVQAFNRKFAEMFSIPQAMLDRRDSVEMVAYAKEQMQDPDEFEARVEALYRDREPIALDIIRFKDGRICERYSQPYRIDGRSIGRVWTFRDVTARHKAAEELRQSEERFRTLATHAPVGIFEADALGNCVFVNEQWCRIAGVRPGDIIGRPWTLSIHEADVARIRETSPRFLREGRFELEFRIHTPVGEERWAFASATALKDDQGNIAGFLGMVIDINERKLAESALKESEERFRQIFEQTEDAILLFDPVSCSMIDANPTAERLYGLSREELLAGAFGVFKTDAAERDFRRVICSIPGDGILHLENMVNVRRDGSEFNVSVHGKIIRLQGREVIYCTFRDITERIRTEEEARSIQAQLILANKMTSLGLLVSGVAHEINNPNNYIMGNAQLLDKVWQDLEKILEEHSAEKGEFTAGGLAFSQLHQAVPEMLEAIADGSRRIKDIINDLKNYARQGSASMETELDVNKVLSVSLTLLNHHINKHTKNFNLELAEHLPQVRGIPQLLEQVVVNLVMNALQSLPDRQRGVWVGTSYEPDGQAVVITVRDEGIGIPREYMDRITEPFFTTRLDSGGTGLGLSISQFIVKSHHGTMEVTSIPGEGTTFTIRLPACSGD